MSYKRDENSYYLMPCHFGPSHTPRRYRGGDPFTRKDYIVWNYKITFKSDENQLNSICPDRLSVTRPEVTVMICFQSNIDFLAGRGYSGCVVYIPVEFNGEKMKGIKANFLPVSWFDLGDTLSTGREAMGFSKYYCDRILAPRSWGECNQIFLSWKGHRFLEMNLKNKLLKNNSDGLTNTGYSINKDEIGVVHHKFIPNAVDFSKPDADYLVLSKYSKEKEMGVYLEEVYSCDGELKFLPTTWEQMPLQEHVISFLVQLKNKGTISAEISKQRKMNDFTDNIILE